MAESRNLMVKCCTHLWLLEAAGDDTSTMLTHIHEIKSFLTQLTSSSGKGPCSLTQEGENRAAQVCAAKTYATDFSNRNAHCAALEENGNPQVFVPSGHARHRPAKTKTGLEGTFVWKKKQKKASVNKNMHVGPGRQLKKAEAILADEDVSINYSPPCTQEIPEENFPEVVLLATLGVRNCHGCKGQIMKKIASPKDLVFFACRLFEYWDWINKQSGKDVMEIFIFTWQYHVFSYTTIKLQLRM